MGYTWDFRPVWANLDILWLGVVNTLWVTVLALAAGLAIGLAVALLRLQRPWIVRAPVGFAIDFLRITPPLVQLMWVFFALPILIDVRITAFSAAVITLSVQSAAFFAEVYRGGIISVERGQWEAGRAIGMSGAQLMRRVVLPQAVKRMIPAFLERAVELLKTTSLLATIAYADLLYQATQVSQATFRPLETFTVAAVIYLIVILPASLLVRHAERRLAVSGETTM